MLIFVLMLVIIDGQPTYKFKINFVYSEQRNTNLTGLVIIITIQLILLELIYRTKNLTDSWVFEPTPFFRYFS